MNLFVCGDGGNPGALSAVEGKKRRVEEEQQPAVMKGEGESMSVCKPVQLSLA
jgi:hypothetical protein